MIVVKFKGMVALQCEFLNYPTVKYLSGSTA